MNNIFTGQTGACVYFDSDSLMEVNGSYSLVSYFGDGNIYNPASGGYVGTVIDSTQPTNNYSTLDAYAYYWYTKQYGTGVINSDGDSGIGIGYRSDQRSIQEAPTFVYSKRRQFHVGERCPKLRRYGGRSSLWPDAIGREPDGLGCGGERPAQGNAVDAVAPMRPPAHQQDLHVGHGGHHHAGVYDSTGTLVRTLWSGVKYPAGSVTAYWNGLNDSNVPVANGGLHHQALEQQRPVCLGWSDEHLQPVGWLRWPMPTSIPSSRWSSSATRPTTRPDITKPATGSTFVQSFQHQSGDGLWG